jgi:uncharacterized membrane protein YfcA
MIWLGLAIGAAFGIGAGILAIPLLDYLSERQLRQQRRRSPTVIDSAHLFAARRKQRP